MLPDDLSTAILGQGITLVALGLMVIQVGAREIGYWFGQRHSRADAPEREGISLIVGAMLALTSFVIAISLGFATTRHDERRSAGLVEANAIVTAWLRSEAIGDIRSLRIARLIEEYAPLRSAYVTAPNDPAVLDTLQQRTSQLQRRIWAELTPLVRERPDAMTSSLTVALNEVFNAANAQRFYNAMPHSGQVVALLIGMAAIGQLGLGYQLGLRRAAVRWLGLLLALVSTLVIAQILDLASPREGEIRTSVQAYEWVIQGFRQARQDEEREK